jgi:type II secretory pathway component GspD/PulD (secretin)
MKITKATWAFTALLSLAPFAHAQTESAHAEAEPSHLQTRQKFDKSIDCRTLSPRTIASDCAYTNAELKVFHLTNVTQQNEANEILVAARNMAEPSTKMFLIASTNDIVTYTYPAEAARIGEIIEALDRPRKTFRITYTFADTDAGAKIAPEASIVLAEGQNTVMKRGNKVPVVIANVMKDDGSVGSRSQYTYLDVGLLIDTTVAVSNSRGAFIKYKVEQSALVENFGKTSASDPVVNQTSLNGVVQLPAGKPETLGSIELPGSNHRITITAQMEEVQ